MFLNRLPLPRIRFRGTRWWRTPLTLLGIIALCVAIWYGLPMTGVGWLSEISTRVLLILGIVAITLTVYLWRWRQRVRAARQIEDALIPQEPVGDGKELAERMETALATLKKSGGAAYLYDLPWYVIIGPPGAGKTTALANSGIEFPLAQQDAVSGFGGTRFVDFWFAEEAVMIDTAGRYTTQDSDSESDKASWQSFLELLKRSRPNQPINGVVLAFSIEDMMTEDSASLARHAEIVRARLAELHEVLKIDYPVYVMFTKADLIAGFREYFASFSQNRRKLVWGTTFQTNDRKAITHEAVPAEFDRLVSRLSAEVIDRLSEEPDGISRIAIFGLPGQMALLRDNVSDFLRRVFEPTRYKSNAMLRGFYFTSGTQEGTPIDQVLGAMTKTGTAGAFQPGFMSGKGKSFFIHDLLRRVIFAEQGWVGLDQKAVRRAAIMRGLALGSISALSLGTLGVLGYSYWKNASLIRQENAAAATYSRDAVDEIRREQIDDPDLIPVLPLLNEIAALPAGYDRNSAAPRLERAGLGQRERLIEAGADSYSDALERMLRPRMILDLERGMPGIISVGDTTQIYRALKVYLLLGGQGARSDDAAIRSWFEDRWTAAYEQGLTLPMRDQLMRHLDAMLRLDNDRNLLVDIDQATVDAARAAIAQLSLDDQAYAILKEGIAATDVPDWTLDEGAGPNAALVLVTRDGTDLASQAVPAMYTYEGFWSYFFPQLEVVGERLREDQWVLGDLGETGDIQRRLARLDRSLLDRYRIDFKAAWDKVLGNLALTSMNADQPRYQALGAAASASASPLLLLVQSVDQETRLTREFEGVTPEMLAQGGAGGNASTQAAASSVSRSVGARIYSRSSGVQRILLDAVKSGSKAQNRVTGGEAADSPIRPIELIAEDFANWHALLLGEVGQRPIDTLLGNLGAVWSRLRESASSPEQTAAVLPTLLSNLTQYNSQLPAPMAALVDEAESDFRQGAADATLAEMNRALTDRITFFCRDNVISSYPFRKSGRSLSIDNFARFFGPGGLMQAYFNEYLEPLTERTETGLQWRADQPVTERLSDNALLQFQRAEVIRQAYFAGGGTTPDVPITISQVAAQAGVDSALLTINDALVPTVTGSLPRSISWPGSGSSTLLQLSPVEQGRPSAIRLDGNPWTLIDFLQSASSSSQKGDTLRATFSVGGRSITYDFTINAVKNPFLMDELRDFDCPQSLD